MKKNMFLALATVCSFNTALYSDVALGAKLEQEMWDDMKHRNWTAVESKIADDFQSVHTFGSLTKEGEIKLIKDLYLGSYGISDIKVTEHGDTLIVSYMISVREKIDNKDLSAKPAPRLSVWQKIDGKWKWVAHANLKEIPAAKEATSKEAVAPKEAVTPAVK